MSVPRLFPFGFFLVAFGLLLTAPASAQIEPGSERLDLRENERIDRGIDLDPAQVESGALVYAQRCSFCHGLDLAGSTRPVEGRVRPQIVVPPLGLKTKAWRYPEAMLRNLVRFGERALMQHASPATMPAHRGTLSVAEVDDVLAFIKATWTPKMRASQAAITARAAEVERRFDQGLPLLPDRRTGE
ncbi:MAG: cytochrome c [Rhodospirillaceae bacterium]|jgi:mono/diheme cytochrome c family protein|nr:cytochrome c [Rhodospirillaceae bacterium]